MTDDEKSELEGLLSQPAFLKWLYRQTERAGIFVIATNGSDNASLQFAEGRRSLALEALRECEEAQPVSGGVIPALTLIQMLREVAQSAPKEKPLGGRSGIYGELGSDDPDDGDGSGE